MFRDTVDPRNTAGNELMYRARARRNQRTSREPIDEAREIVSEILAGTYPCRPRERAKLLSDAESMGILPQ